MAVSACNVSSCEAPVAKITPIALRLWSSCLSACAAIVRPLRRQPFCWRGSPASRFPLQSASFPLLRSSQVLHIRNKGGVQTHMRSDRWLLMPPAITLRFRLFDPGPPRGLAGGLGSRSTRRIVRTNATKTKCIKEMGISILPAFLQITELESPQQRSSSPSNLHQ